MVYESPGEEGRDREEFAWFIGYTPTLVSLSRLTWHEIEALYSAMRSAGMGVDWIRRCATVLTRTLELARKRGLLDANPAKDAARPRTAHTKPIAPSGDEVRKVVVTAAKRDPEIADAVTVLVSTGMRRGELLALQWSDVDFKKDELNVSAAITDGVAASGSSGRRPSAPTGAMFR